jgi:cytochrome c5
MSGEHKFNIVPLLVGTVVLIAIIITLAMIIGGKSKRVEDEAEIIARIQPVAQKVEAVAAAADVGTRTGEQMVQAACAACHMSGAAGAPKIGDKGAWAARIGKGLDGLLKSAIAGKNAMLPRGGSDATDTELARAIAYMANQSGAKFTEPK